MPAQRISIIAHQKHPAIIVMTKIVLNHRIETVTQVSVVILAKAFKNFEKNFSDFKTRVISSWVSLLIVSAISNNSSYIYIQNLSLCMDFSEFFDSSRNYYQIDT